MSLRFLLDTHIAVRWLSEPRKLSRNQRRVLEEAINRNEPVAISAITLLETAVLMRERATRSNTPTRDLLQQIEASPVFQVLPLTFEIATEVAALGDSLRDPADRAIVATARVHRLTLVTSDQRIISSNLITIVE